MGGVLKRLRVRFTAMDPLSPQPEQNPFPGIILASTRPKWYGFVCKLQSPRQTVIARRGQGGGGGIGLSPGRRSEKIWSPSPFRFPLIVGLWTPGLAPARGRAGRHGGTGPVVSDDRACGSPSSGRHGFCEAGASSADIHMLREDSLRFMARAGVDTYVEAGSRKVLSGRVRRIVPGSRSFNVQDPPSRDVMLKEIETMNT